MHLIWEHQDRRQFQRLKMNINVFYSIQTPVYVRVYYGDSEFEAATVDLSEGGMAFLTKQEIPVGSILTMRFCLFKMDEQGKIDFLEPLQIEAEVRSKHTHDVKLNRLGVCFSRKDAAVIHKIADFIHTNSCINSVH